MGQNVIVDRDQVSRLGKLCKVLSAKNGRRLQHLQRKLGTSRRTIFRDLAVLGEMGVDVQLTEDGYALSQSLAESRARIADYHRSALDKLLRNCLK